MAADIAATQQQQCLSRRPDILFPDDDACDGSYNGDGGDGYWDTMSSVTYARHLQRASQRLDTTPPRRPSANSPTTSATSATTSATSATSRSAECRRTWSAASFERVTPARRTDDARRGRHGKSEDGGDGTATEETPAPPRITPVSGRLNAVSEDDDDAFVFVCIVFLFGTLSPWGSSNYRPSAPFLYEVASHVKKVPFRPLLLVLFTMEMFCSQHLFAIVILITYMLPGLIYKAC